MNEKDKTFYLRLGATTLAVILVMVEVRLLFFSGGSSFPKPVACPGISNQVISWQDAGNHYGETCTVKGKVVATHNSGKRCLLNFHPNWKKYFTAVIFRDCFSAFPASPEQHYLGKKVLVTGYIKQYKGRPEIVLESPDQIEIIE